jgi:Zinc-finger of C2H2 type
MHDIRMLIQGFAAMHKSSTVAYPLVPPLGMQPMAAFIATSSIAPAKTSCGSAQVDAEICDKGNHAVTSDLDAKSTSKTAVGSWRCSICKVDCNSLVTRRQHEAGARHVARSAKATNTAPCAANDEAATKIPTTSAEQIIEFKSDAPTSKEYSTRKGLKRCEATGEKLPKPLVDMGKASDWKMETGAIAEGTADGAKRSKTLNCELCHVVCKSFALLRQHNASGKHLKRCLEEGLEPPPPIELPPVVAAASKRKRDDVERETTRKGVAEDVDAVLQAAVASAELEALASAEANQSRAHGVVLRCNACKVEMTGTTPFRQHLTRLRAPPLAQLAHREDM